MDTIAPSPRAHPGSPSVCLRCFHNLFTIGMNRVHDTIRVLRPTAWHLVKNQVLKTLLVSDKHPF